MEVSESAAAGEGRPHIVTGTANPFGGPEGAWPGHRFLRRIEASRGKDSWLAGLRCADYPAPPGAGSRAAGLDSSRCRRSLQRWVIT